MIQRAIIFKINREESRIYTFLKLFLSMNRVYYPHLILTLITSSLFFYLLRIDTLFTLYALLILQTLFASISWHEVIHISFARFLNYNPIFVSFSPYSFGARTHFERSKKIQDIDKAGILLSAPIILTFIGIILLITFINLSIGSISLIFVCSFLSINLLSLLPCKKCDGGRAYLIFKKTGRRSFLLCVVSIFVYVLWSIGFKNILATNVSGKEDGEE